MENIRIEILKGPLSSELVPNSWRSGEHGAVVTFLGIVRARNHGRQVKSVYYEAFVPLAESFLRQICGEALEKFGVKDGRIYLAHSEGDIQPGQTSLVVITATAHRAEAFMVTQHVIDELKKRVPIWKHERYSDGSSAWLRGCALHEAPQ